MFVTFITIIISSLLKFDHYRDTRAAILDPCIQGIFILPEYLYLETSMVMKCNCKSKVKLIVKLFPITFAFYILPVLYCKTPFENKIPVQM